MKGKKILAIVGAGVFSALLVSPSAFAFPWPFHAEARTDRHELNHDRRELRQDLRHGAPAGEIARDRAEIYRDNRSLAQDRWDRNYYNNYNRYPYDNYNRDYNYNRGWYDRFGYWHWR